LFYPVLLFDSVHRYAKAILFFTIFFDLLGFGIVIPILPNYVKEMTESDFLVGMPVTLFALSQFFFTPIWGSLSDKYGRRPIILISLVLSLIAYFVLSFADSFLMLLFARILSGIGSGNISAAQAYISDVTDPKDRAKSMGMIGAAFGLGFIFGPPIGGFLMEDFGFSSIGHFCMLLCALNLILAYFFLPESLKERRYEVKINLLPIKDYRYVFSKPLLPFILFIGFIYTAGFFLFQIPSTLMWKERFHFSEKEIGWIFTFIGVCTALVQGGMIGFLNRWFGEKKLLFWGNVLLALSVLGIPFVSKAYFIPVELILLFGIAVANGCVGPSALSVVSQIAPEKEKGLVMGIYQSFSSLARAAGPILGSSLYGISFFTPFLAACFIYGANAIITFFFLKRLRNF
jgi:multidrug resistance protein